MDETPIDDLSPEEVDEFFEQLNAGVALLTMLDLTDPVPNMKPMLNEGGHTVLVAAMALLAMHEPDKAVPVFKKFLGLARQAQERSRARA